MKEGFDEGMEHNDPDKAISLREVDDDDDNEVDELAGNAKTGEKNKIRIYQSQY